MSSTKLVNLLVDLDERFAGDAAARERIERAGFALDVAGGANDPVLAWIDEVFGGAWSSEVAVAQCALATRDGKPAGFAAFDPTGYAMRGCAGSHANRTSASLARLVSLRHKGVGSLLLQIALCGLRARGYPRALIAATSDGFVPYYERHADARVVERYDPRSFTPARCAPSCSRRAAARIFKR